MSLLDVSFNSLRGRDSLLRLLNEVLSERWEGTEPLLAYVASYALIRNTGFLQVLTGQNLRMTERIQNAVRLRDCRQYLLPNDCPMIRIGNTALTWVRHVLIKFKTFVR